MYRQRLRLIFLLLVVSLGIVGTGSILGSRASTNQANAFSSLKYVWLIMFENHSWSDILGSASAPYINTVVLPEGASSTNYYDMPYGHPSLAAYLTLEAGSNLGVTTDGPPSQNRQTTTDHLVSQLHAAGQTWRGYIEGISGQSCPVTNNLATHYAVRHNPQVYFTDVTQQASFCIAHERPLGQMRTDLAAGRLFNFTYILPNLCHDMHSYCATSGPDEIKAGDQWLSTVVPVIQQSAAYQQSGAIFISWDEGTDGLNNTDSDGPVGMIVLSPFIKGPGYVSAVFSTHAGTLRTFEEIFGVPLLRDATSATDLGDLFA